MKKSIFPVLVILAMFITLLSCCTNRPERSRQPVSLISIQPQKQSYRLGEEVTVQVSTTLRNGEIDNIKLYYAGELITESNELDFSVSGVELTSLGISSFRTVATKTDSVSNTRSKTITVLSDVTPEKYSYQTVNSFPHNTDFYTQGLEYFDGLIYEGTGEYGESGLYKVNLEAGDILSSYEMPDEYFGEGITILGDKIYQLTYRAQKGFIYNRSDFALIDSFQYAQEEGWGLTNDGEYLIMSDGTNVLTWLDPEDFSVVKTVQVANAEGVVNNLNELEYINGTIFANIYTTNFIVEIQPETGKVISDINLNGILNMYMNQSNRVDYMNGIAWDETNERMFVTGKWWPRMFEIELVPSE